MIDKYYDKLYKFQDKVISDTMRFYTESYFYLTGGTALNRFFYPTRYSDDLDFFTNENRFFRKAIKNLLYFFKDNGYVFKVDIDSLDFVRLVFEENYSQEQKIFLKVDFVNDRLPYLGEILFKDEVALDNPINILTNKICAVYSRDEARDIVDIITIALNNNFNWDDILDFAKQKCFFENSEIIARLKSFPVSWFHDVNRVKFIYPELSSKYRKLYPILVENIEEGGENRLPKSSL